MHVHIKERDKIAAACEMAFSWLLTQANNIKVIPRRPQEMLL